MLQLSCGPPLNLHSGLFHICRSGKSKSLWHQAVVGSNLSLPTYQLRDPEQVFYLLSLAVLLSSFVGLLWGLSEVTWRGTSLPGTGWAPNNCQVPREIPALTVVTTDPADSHQLGNQSGFIYDSLLCPWLTCLFLFFLFFSAATPPDCCSLPLPSSTNLPQNDSVSTPEQSRDHSFHPLAQAIWDNLLFLSCSFVPSNQ